MEPVTIGIISVIVLFTLVILGVHVGVALGMVSVCGVWLITGRTEIAISLISTTFFAAVKDYVFAVVPLFILVGVILSHAELSKDLFIAAHSLTGRIRGGLAIATVGANAIFAAIVGSTVASAAAFSKIAYQPMVELGYSRRLSLGTIAGSSVLGMLIPPSLLFIIYGVLTGESVGKMFVAGIFPGILLASIYCVGIIIMAKIRPSLVGGTKQPTMNTGERLHTVLKTWPVVLLIITVLGGIWGGLFTATEAAGVGAIGAFVISLAMRRLNLDKVKLILMETGLTCGSILFLLITAQMYSRMIALSGLVSWLNGLILGSSLPQMVIILLFLLVIVFLGMLIDSTSILLLTVPLILPVMKSFELDPIWFGIVLVVTVELGLITPPFGMSAFTVRSSLGDSVSLEEIYKGSIPFLLMMLLCIALLIAFPAISTWLPNRM